MRFTLKKIVGVLRTMLWELKSCGRFKAESRVVLGSHSKIMTRKKTQINMAKGCIISENVYISVVEGTISIGNNNFFNRNIIIACRKKIQIGNNCSIGPGVTIYDHDHKIGKNGIEQGYNTKEIIIEDHCWIGANVTILRGTHIGKNCVIGAGCVVKGNIPDGTLVVPETKNRFIDLNEKYGTQDE